MAFLDEFDALDPVTAAKERAGLVARWLADRPAELFAELRAKRPILVAPGTCVVTRHPDVREVLATDRVFSVRPYTARMERTTGAFFLGMPRNGQYDRELAAMRLAADRADLDRVAAIVRKTAEGLVGGAKGRLDLAGGYARRVALRVIADYFGTPGPDEPTMAGWLAVLFRDIFLNLGNDPAVTAAATEAAAGLKAYLDPLIARRRAAPGPETDVLSRLARLATADGPALDPDGVRRNIGGTIVGAAETVNKAFVQALDQLLDRPAGLAQAQAAAAAGDDATVMACVWEAMRFRPQNPFLYRVCEEPYTLARGTDRATLVPAGTLVFAATSSAMMEAEFVRDPDQFRPGRPPESYLFFGHALHTCFGQFVAAVEFRELARPLLKLPNLRRAAGADGQIRFDGPFPASLWVEFG